MASVRFQTRTTSPARNRLRAIPDPMIPVPSTATVGFPDVPELLDVLELRAEPELPDGLDEPDGPDELDGPDGREAEVTRKLLRVEGGARSGRSGLVRRAGYAEPRAAECRVPRVSYGWGAAGATGTAGNQPCPPSPGGGPAVPGWGSAGRAGTAGWGGWAGQDGVERGG
ncbi:hypothetical protein GCM10010331_36290 [Streptomyces xanthochromogenes]|nr:hypothetical protein GCM10010331_36290 [Streptomyces xanthochromogenes]